MTPQSASTAPPLQLLRLANGVVVQQAIYAAAKLGIADLLNDGQKTAKELASQLRVNESGECP